MSSYSKDVKNKARTMDKKDSLKLHAKKRCRERCGITLDESCYSLVLRAIHGEKINGLDVKFKIQQSSRIFHYTIKFGNMVQQYGVVYDKSRDVIVTFLPIDEKDGSPFYHYTNWIGNVINIKDAHGISLKLQDGELTGPYLNITKLKETDWYIEDINKTLQLRDNKLYEI
jgi:hypothetical protein